MKKITYKNVCRECGSEKRLITVKHAEGDYHLCQKCFAAKLHRNNILKHARLAVLLFKAAIRCKKFSASGQRHCQFCTHRVLYNSAFFMQTRNLRVRKNHHAHAFNCLRHERCPSKMRKYPMWPRFNTRCALKPCLVKLL